MTIARILTPMQVMMLRETLEIKPVAAKREALKEVTALIKTQSPGLFFHETKDGKPDPTMCLRRFHDQPSGLDLNREYAGYNVPYAGINQAKIFKTRGQI